MKLQERSGTHWVWWSRLDRRNGYLAWGPVGQPFNRSRPLHWVIAFFDLWRKGHREAANPKDRA